MAKTCFVIGPIGGEGTDTRKRADDLLKHIIRKALEPPPFAMDVKRADEMAPGLITHQIIERVVNAELVVADLTDRNANALYELALRHVTRKPVVHMVLAGQDLPFDIVQQRTVRYDTQNLDAAEQARDDLRKHVEAVLKNPDLADNPITTGLHLLDLAKSKDTTAQTLGRILAAVTELREDLRGAVQRGTGESSPLQEALRLIRRKKTGRPDSETLRQIGQALYHFSAAGTPIPVPTCANCGKPIVGPMGQRSSDNAPIHWEGKCPPPDGGLLQYIQDKPTSE